MEHFSFHPGHSAVRSIYILTALGWRACACHSKLCFFIACQCYLQRRIILCAGERNVDVCQGYPMSPVLFIWATVEYD